jgi:O-antigen/teichoic acid export membrane protein
VRQRLGRAAIVFGSRVGMRAAQVVSFVVLARVLSPSDFGHYGVITSGVLLVGLVGHLGLRPAGAHAIGQRIHSDGTVGATVLLAWPLLTALSCVALWMSGLLIPSQLLTTQLAIVVATAAILLIALAQGVFLGRGQTGHFAFSDLAPRVAVSVLTVLAWWLSGLTLEVALALFAASFALCAGPVVAMMFRGARDRRPAPSALPMLIRRGLLFAVSVTLVMLQGRIGLFFLASTDAHAAAGQFFAAQRATEMFLEIATAFGLVMFSDATRSADPVRAVSTAVRTATALFVLFLAIGLAAMPAAPWLVHALLGAQYTEAVPLLRILLLGLGFAAATRIMNNVVAGLGHPWMSAGIAALALAANFLMCAWLVPRHGAAGAAIALVTGQTIAASAYFALTLAVRQGRVAVPVRSATTAAGLGNAQHAQTPATAGREA